MEATATATKNKLEVMTPATMLEKAITTGANVEVMEKLLALQERWEANQARKAFDAALADVRADLPAIVKTKAVSFGQGRASYKYEDLSDMIDQLSPALSRHGLSFRWRTESTAPDSVTVTCILSHRDGHSETTSLTAKHDNSGGKNMIQAIGSVVTYLQRYTLKASVGVAAGVDDDAQSVSGRPESKPRDPLIDKLLERNYVQHLGASIMEFVNHDKKAATEILEQLTGKKSLKELTQADAAEAQALFEKQYMSAGQNEDTGREPGSDDDAR